MRKGHLGLLNSRSRFKASRNVRSRRRARASAESLAGTPANENRPWRSVFTSKIPWLPPRNSSGLMSPSRRRSRGTLARTTAPLTGWPCGSTTLPKQAASGPSAIRCSPGSFAIHWPEAWPSASIQSGTGCALPAACLDRDRELAVLVRRRDRVVGVDARERDRLLRLGVDDDTADRGAGKLLLREPLLEELLHHRVVVSRSSAHRAADQGEGVERPALDFRRQLIHPLHETPGPWRAGSSGRSRCAQSFLGW